MKNRKIFEKSSIPLAINCKLWYHTQQNRNARKETPVSGARREAVSWTGSTAGKKRRGEHSGADCLKAVGQYGCVPLGAYKRQRQRRHCKAGGTADFAMHDSSRNQLISGLFCMRNREERYHGICGDRDSRAEA